MGSNNLTAKARAAFEYIRDSVSNMSFTQKLNLASRYKSGVSFKDLTPYEANLFIGLVEKIESMDSAEQITQVDWYIGKRK